MRAVSSLILATALSAFAQVPAFEVASVKASDAGPAGPRMRADMASVTAGGVTMMGVNLKAVIQWAYHLQSIQVQGPGFIDTNRYDIVAKAPGPASKEELRHMMQSLLEQRFKLAFHKETKEMQAYVFTVAKGGHKLKQSEGEGELTIQPTGKGLNVAFSHVTLSEFTEMAGSPLQGVVVDQTGLTGAWDFTLDGSMFALNQPTGIDDVVNMMVQIANEQLGIKIEQKKVPAEVFVVERAEKIPVEN
jgi:uncharacterized protein (TIGR03435 family)